MQRNLRRGQLFVLIVGVALSVAVWQFMRLAEDRAMADSSHVRADAARLQISSALSSYFKSLERMAVRWEALGGMELEAWSVDASSHVRQLEGISSVQLVGSDFLVRAVVPYKGNEKLVGVDVGIEALRAALARASDAVPAPFAIYGERGLLYVVPLLRNGRFDGLVLGVFGHQQLFDRIVPSYLLDGFALVVTKESQELYRRSRGPFPDNPEFSAAREVRLPGGVTLGVHLLASPQLIAARRSHYPIAMLIVGLLLTVLIERILELHGRSLEGAADFARLNRSLESKVAELEEVRNSLEERGVELKRQRRAALNIAADAKQAKEQAESAEREAAHFEAIVRLSQDAIISKDLNSVITSWNEGAQRLFGYTSEEAVGQRVHFIIPPSLYDEEEKMIEQIRAGERVEHFETKRVSRDGREIEVSVAISPVSDDSGRVIGASTVMRDVSERKEAEERFRLAVESSPNAMVMIDKDGQIVLVNAETERIFGYSREELLGRPVEMLIPERFRQAHPLQREHFLRKPRARAMGAGRDLYGLRKDRSEVPIEIGLNPIITSRGAFVLSAIVDITQRKRAEEFMRQSLSEKEVLLKEIHHRVKNNMQVISSLLKLQSHHVPDPAARELFRQSDERVRSMALIHERLYRSEGFADIDFAEYVEELTRTLIRSYAVDQSRIDLSLDLERVRLGVDQGIPCGLLLNEFISNALKHAFPPNGGTQGQIRVELREEGEEVILSVADNGRGLPPDFDISRPTSLGFEIIKTLSEQLQAQLEIIGEEGTRLLLKFKRTAGERIMRSAADSNGSASYSQG